MKRAVKATPIEILDEARIDLVAQSIRQAGAIPNSKLMREKLSVQAQHQLMAGLVLRGLERSAKVVRVPVEEQLMRMVSGGTRIPYRGLLRRIKGAGKAEMDGALRKLTAAGKLRIVVRMQVEVLVDACEQMLCAEELKNLAKVSDSLVKTLKKVNAKGHARSMLREDLRALMEPINACQQSEAKHQKTGEEEFWSALKRFEHPQLKLIRIAELVRALERKMTREQIHQWLHEFAERGQIELRPELPGEFLSETDARLCPEGSRGTFFSYARFRAAGANP